MVTWITSSTVRIHPDTGTTFLNQGTRPQDTEGEAPTFRLISFLPVGVTELNELQDEAAIDAFLTRFRGFFDAVLTEIVLTFPEAARDRRGKLRFLTQDREEASWFHVTLEVTGLTEYRFAEGPGTYLVLSDGLHIHFFEGALFVDMAPYTEVPPLSAADVRRSEQYVVGDKCYFEVSAVRSE